MQPEKQPTLRWRSVTAPPNDSLVVPLLGHQGIGSESPFLVKGTSVNRHLLSVSHLSTQRDDETFRVQISLLGDSKLEKDFQLLNNAKLSIYLLSTATSKYIECDSTIYVVINFFGGKSFT